MTTMLKSLGLRMTAEDTEILKAGIEAYSARKGFRKPLKTATAAREWLLSKAAQEIANRDAQKSEQRELTL